MSDFISRHLVKKIEEEIDSKSKRLGIVNNVVETPFYLDELVKNYSSLRGVSTTLNINRVRLYKYQSSYRSAQFFYENGTTPYSFHMLKGAQLKDIFFKLRDNKFFIYKKIEGKNLKVRLKK